MLIGFELCLFKNPAVDWHELSSDQWLISAHWVSNEPEDYKGIEESSKGVISSG